MVTWNREADAPKPRVEWPSKAERLEDHLREILRICNYGGPVDVSQLADIEIEVRYAINVLEEMKGESWWPRKRS